MSALIYIHGFLSSPKSYKAQLVKSWVEENRPDIDYYCPFLPPYPNQAKTILDDLIQSLEGEPVYLMGSSLGGFWCTYLVERYNLPAVLINPAVKPSMLLPEYLNCTLKNYSTDDTYVLKEHHIEELKAVDVKAVARINNYWVMLQTGDETLDYRLAAEKYSACELLIEEGGDHGFQNFERWIPETIGFLERRLLD